jgi:3-deoxy-D-manno-octulosonic-acid transferase
MIIWLYNLGMVCYAGLIRLAAMWNPKAKAMLLGWRETKTLNRTQIHHQISGVVSPSFELIWIHCASLGEFEMAKPIAAALQAASSQRHVLFSFFSPSGYNHAVLDINQTKVYLPLDGASSAKRWMQQWNPQAAIFIRYEFWYHYMKSLHQNQIPAFALGVAIAPNHFLLSRIAQPWRKQLQQFQAIGLINQNMCKLATQNQFHNAFVFGDPKFNRAAERALLPSPLQNPEIHTNTNTELLQWMRNKPTLILGSAWQPEIQLLQQFIQQYPQALENWQILIAPHNLNPQFIQSIQQAFSEFPTAIFSENPPNNNHTIAILNTIGQLAQCYRFGTIAIIGGAFGKGLHNTIEAAAFGLPIVFGPNHNKFPEASQFIQAGFGFSVNHQNQFNQTLLQLIQQHSPNQPHPMSQSAAQFVQNHVAKISEFVKLTYPQALKQGSKL